MRPGDQVFVYFSGPGQAVAADDRSRCVASWITKDGRRFDASGVAARLGPALADAGKLLLVADTSYRPVSEPARRVASSPSLPACDRPAPTSFGLVGPDAANLVALEAAGPLQGVEQAEAGGLFTQALLDCVAGDAEDLDRSGSISIAELAQCIDVRARGAAPLAAASGNVGYSPALAIAPRVAMRDDGASGDAARRAIADVLAQRDGRIDVTLRATPATLAIGRDALALDLASSRDGYVYLVLLGSDGRTFDVLFPNDLDRDNAIRAGQTLQLPRPHWAVRSQGPPGRDVVLAIVAESERDLAAFTTKDGPFAASSTDTHGRATLQSMLGRAGRLDRGECAQTGARRNLAVVRACSDAYGAAVVEVEER